MSLKGKKKQLTCNSNCSVQLLNCLLYLAHLSFERQYKKGEMTLSSMFSLMDALFIRE